jgi:hypothetical protein
MDRRVIQAFVQELSPMNESVLTRRQALNINTLHGQSMGWHGRRQYDRRLNNPTNQSFSGANRAPTDQ